MARRIDSKGIRTVGVVTKIDIMDRGTNAKRMIMNQEIQLRLGFADLAGFRQGFEVPPLKLGPPNI